MSESFPDREMTILEHLEELRRRLVIAGIATVVCFVIAAIFFTWPVMEFLTKPAGMKLVALSPTETFATYMKVALATGAAMAMPVIVLETLLFVVPALHPHERNYVLLAVPSVTVAFVIGVLFGLFVVVPAAVRFLVGFAGETVDPMWSIAEYLGFVSSFLFWIGVAFETPLLMFFLAKLGVVNAQQLARFRRYAIVGAFVAGAIITPTPDPFNQTIVAIPLYLLYELGVLFARFA